MKKISAIIACYRDQEAIPIMHERLVKTFVKIGVDYEIIFVNDGSPDQSESVLKELVEKDGHVIAVNHSRNFSSQMAFTSGMEIATGDAVVLLDGDLQDPPELIEQFYQKWQEGYEVVFGVRTKRETTFLMQWCYKMFYFIFHKMSYVKIPLHAGDFSLIDRVVVDFLKQFPERDRFVRGLRAWVGFKQTGVSYVRPERMFGKSTNDLVKNFNWALKGIFSFSYVPLEFITFIALITFFISVIGIIVQVILRFMIPETPQGITTVLVVMMFLGSVQLLSISIIGQYVGKIFEEVKQRPKYIVKSTLRKKMAILLLTGLLSMAPGMLWANEYPWQLKRDKQDITAYTRKVEGSSILEFKSSVTLDAPIEKAIALYEDETKMTQWFHQCVAFERVQGVDDIFYFVIHLPWPVAERDTVFKRLKLTDPETGVISYELSALPEQLPLRKGRIRVPYLKTTWRFTPLVDGRTEVYFQQHSDAGGSIPALIVNKLVVDIPFNSLKNFRRLIMEEKN